jgi:hypothetical protein
MAAGSIQTSALARRNNCFSTIVGQRVLREGARVEPRATRMAAHQQVHAERAIRGVTRLNIYIGAIARTGLC